MVSCNPVKALFKSPEARHVSTIFVRIEDEVPLEGEPFLLHAILAAPVHCFEDRATLEEMQRFERRFVDVISSRPRIQFARKYSDDEASIDVRLLPEEDVTLADLQDYKRLDADYPFNESLLDERASQFIGEGDDAGEVGGGGLIGVGPLSGGRGAVEADLRGRAAPTWTSHDSAPAWRFRPPSVVFRIRYPAG
jgi:hypothetical protein